MKHPNQSKFIVFPFITFFQNTYLLGKDETKQTNVKINGHNFSRTFIANKIVLEKTFFRWMKYLTKLIWHSLGQTFFEIIDFKGGGERLTRRINQCSNSIKVHN